MSDVSEVEKATEDWWITTDWLAQGGRKVLGPFISKDLAMEVRVLREAFEGVDLYFVDSEPRRVADEGESTRKDR